MKIKKGDKVIIKGSAEENKYKDCIFEVLSEPYKICGSEAVKIKCHETGKYFGGGYDTEFLELVEDNEIDESNPVCYKVEINKLIKQAKENGLHIGFMISGSLINKIDLTFEDDNGDVASATVYDEKWEGLN